MLGGEMDVTNTGLHTYYVYMDGWMDVLIHPSCGIDHPYGGCVTYRQTGRTDTECVEECWPVPSVPSRVSKK